MFLSVKYVLYFTKTENDDATIIIELPGMTDKLLCLCIQM